MREWLDALLAVLLAPTCGACEHPLLYPTRGCVCPDCWRAIVLATSPCCRRCGDPLSAESSTLLCGHCIGSRSDISAARAIGPHVGSLRAIVHALKYDGRRSLARPVAALMRIAGADLLGAAAAAVPVPLHAARRRSRGFNQADDLSRHIGLPVVHALKRVRQTQTQTALPAGERHANVAGAFRATRHARQLQGSAVVLIDDVRTTGATLEACAAVLRATGVREVFALTAARVETPGL